jgi:hypothetical protein
MEAKIFIIGLPRTGTTSICAALLKLGFRVAHTAYSQKCLTTAQVIADTPVFSDYQQLAQQFPQAKFIYLTRDLDLWIPSIRQLLQRMYKNIVRNDGGFNPVLKRCYQKTFSPFTLENFAKDDFLIQCYQRHQTEIENFFADKTEKLLSFDISKANSYQSMCNFLQVIPNASNAKTQFEKINTGGKITAWNKIKHPLKIDSLLK